MKGMATHLLSVGGLLGTLVVADAEEAREAERDATVLRDAVLGALSNESAGFQGVGKGEARRLTWRLAAG